MKAILFSCILSLTIYSGCKEKVIETGKLDEIALSYTRLGLEIGQYDADFVDAYYGPDSLKPAGKQDTAFPKERFLSAVNVLSNQIDSLIPALPDTGIQKKRANWMKQQLVAFSRRIRIFSGERASFEIETKELFNVDVPQYSETDFKSWAAELDSLLPGDVSLQDRLDALNSHFTIPKEKVDTVFKLALAESRRVTSQHFAFPKNESFILEYVTGKPWSGYNWYKGNYQSIIQINTDLPIMIDRAIDLACHEGYPGHHVYNMLLEKNLYRDKGWTEISLYPLFSPQSLIAEGSANYGIDLAFPEEQRIRFLKEVLLPAADLDSEGIETYLRVLELKGKLNYVRNEVARGIINKTMTEDEALNWLTNYGLSSPASAAKSVSFIKKYGSYVICYNYGLDLVRQYIGNGTEESRWKLFGELLSNPVLPGELEGKMK